MPVYTCARGCSRLISVSNIPGGNPTALADPEGYAIAHIACNACGRKTCDRCAAKQPVLSPETPCPWCQGTNTWSGVGSQASPKNPAPQSPPRPKSAQPRIQPTEKPGLLWPFLLSMFLLTPGMLTYTFALREARSYSGDWILISSPLLLLGGLALASFIGRLLGRITPKLALPGLLLGLLGVVAGLGAAAFMVNERIEERLEHTRQYEAYRAALPTFCQDAGAPIAQAIRFKKDGTRSIYPVDVLGPGKSYDKLEVNYDRAFKDLRPSKPYLSKIALVACLEDTTFDLQTCQYDRGAATRKRTDRRVRLYAVKTGKLVLDTVMTGETPRACETVEKFYSYGTNDTNLSKTIAGAKPSDADVAELLMPYVKSKNAKKKTSKSKKKSKKSKKKKSKKKKSKKKSKKSKSP